MIKALGLHSLAVVSVVVFGWCLGQLISTWIGPPVVLPDFVTSWVALSALIVALEQSPKIKRAYEQAARKK